MTRKQPSIREVLAAINAGFHAVEAHFAANEKRFTAIDARLDTLTTAVAELAATVNSFLKQEWVVHQHATHARLEARLRAIERKLGIKAV